MPIMQQINVAFDAMSAAHVRVIRASHEFATSTPDARAVYEHILLICKANYVANSVKYYGLLKTYGQRAA